MPLNDSESIGALWTEGVTMQYKKTQVELKQNGRPPLPEVVRAPLDERSGRQSFRTDPKSIVSAGNSTYLGA